MDIAGLSRKLFDAIAAGNLAAGVSLAKVPGVMQTMNERGNTPLMEAIVAEQEKVCCCSTSVFPNGSVVCSIHVIWFY